jgi:hypothetical protein
MDLYKNQIEKQSRQSSDKHDGIELIGEQSGQEVNLDE